LDRLVTDDQSPAGRLLALSDDFTGAAACGGELAGAGRRVAVKPSEAQSEWPPGYDAVVLDTSSRLVSGLEGGARLKSALVAWLSEDSGSVQHIYKRIDTGLRGNIEEELRTLSATLGCPCVVAPAAPTLGVTTRDGVQLLDGEEITRSRYGGREAPQSACLAEMLPDDCTQFPLASVRDDDFPTVLADACRTHDFVVCDAETTGDLVRVAEAVVALQREGQAVACVGSYGLAGAWMRVVGSTGQEDRGPGILVVAGSLMGATAEQVRLLRECGGAIHSGDVSASGSRLRAGETVTVALPPSSPPVSDPRVKTTLALQTELIVQTARPRGVVLIGGETASAVIRACAVERTDVIAEPWPATPLVVFAGGSLDGSLGIVKSGALGDSSWLLNAVSLLKGIEQRAVA
jgi:uncharacterized protein YgbK (DUF1537 family)